MAVLLVEKLLLESFFKNDERSPMRKAIIETFSILWKNAHLENDSDNEQRLEKIINQLKEE